MKRNALLILSLLVTFAAWANPRSWQQAKAIAQQQAAQIGITLSPSGIANAKPGGQATQTDATYYVFANDKDKGYVIVSGDDQMPDIVSYSATGTYSADHMPPALAAMLQAYDATVKAVQSGDKKALRTVEEAKALRAEKTSAAVAPLLGDIQWNQGEPYNNKCPIYDENGHIAATGCAATAMAQVMAYHKYPSQLLADIPAYTTKTKRILMPGIAQGETFDWDNIIPQYVEENYTAEQADAVANLMLICGCALQMDYDESSGTTYSTYVLTHYFGYDQELVQHLLRDGFTLKQWTDIIDQELQAKRPILYAASDVEGGHAFVCDGTDGNGLYHINWGWGGRYDNYFDISILNYTKPENPEEDGDGFTRNCNMIIGITPDNGVVDEQLVDAVPIFAMTINAKSNYISWEKSKRRNETEKFTGKIVATFGNYSAEDFAGYFAVGVKNANGAYDFLGKSTKPDSLKPSQCITYHMNFSYAFPVGSTELYYLYSTDGKTWKPCGITDFMPFLLTATETEIKTEDSPLVIDFDLEDGGQLVAQQAVTGIFNITNRLNEEFNGYIGLYMQGHKAGSKTYKVGSVYVSIPAGATITKKTTVIPGEAGDATLYIVDGSGIVLNQAECTVEDNTTAISAPVSTDQVASNVIGGKGCITVKASEAKTIAVYNANGQKAAELSIKGGEQKTITLQPGVYIVDKTKVVVR